MVSIEDAYRILGLNSDSDATAVERAYRRKQQEFETDPSADPWEFERIHEAWKTIREAAADLPPKPKPETLATEPEIPKHLVWQAFFRQLPLQNETNVFILVNVLDIVMTFALLRLNAIETNPIANYFLRRWGMDGMIFLKMLSVAFVCVLAQVIARHDLPAARRLMIAGTIIVGAVVVYSASLLARSLS